MADLEISIPAGTEAAGLARRALADVASNLPPPVVEDLKLLVSELVTNSVRHAGLGPTASIRVRLRSTGNTVRVEVVDPGPGFEPSTASPTLYQHSGWGLYFVREIADRWGVLVDGGTRVWFEIDAA